MRISSSVGDGLEASRAWADMIIPGVQNPHWTPPLGDHVLLEGVQPVPAMIPSMVVMDRPSAWTAR